MGKSVIRKIGTELSLSRKLLDTRLLKLMFFIQTIQSVEKVQFLPIARLKVPESVGNNFTETRTFFPTFLLTPRPNSPSCGT
jgi:hypothetical protein